MKGINIPVKLKEAQRATFSYLALIFLTIVNCVK